MTEKPENIDLSKLRIDRAEKTAQPQKRMIGKYQTIAIVVLLTCVAVLFLLRSPKTEVASSENKEASYPSQALVSGGETLNATGYVVAQRQAAVASKATGRLKELNVEEGDLVKKDQVLGVLENDDLEALVKEREANVLSLEAKVNFSKAELEEAKLNHTRIVELQKKTVASQAELDSAAARLKKASSDIEAAKAAVVLSNAQLAKAKVDLSYTYIVAPFDGTVLTKNADVGEIVAPMGSSTNARAAIVTIADMSSLEVEADVSESNMTKIFVGQECEITLDSFPGKTYRGVVSKIVPTVDRAKATVLTKIKFVERDKNVIPEMSAKVAFKVER